MIRLFLHIVLLLLVPVYASGQEFTGHSNTHLNVYNYSGAVSSDAHTLVFDYTGTNLNVPNWKISMKLLGPIMSEDGKKEFPSRKVSLVPVRTDGQANNPGPVPTLSQIGVPSSVNLNGMQEVFLVPSSNAPLYNVSPYSSYFRMRIIFNLVVAGGAYLAELQDYDRFIVPFQFTAYRGDNTVIGSYTMNYTIMVHKLGGTPPPDENEYSIRVSTEASNGLLEFNTVSDYVNGKSVTYANGLAVTATTPYQVTVRSVFAHFSSDAGNRLPLDAVQLQLSGGDGTMPPVTLSTATKTILEGSSTSGTARYLDITYSTGANDQRLFTVPPDQYATSLVYEISPR